MTITPEQQTRINRWARRITCSLVTLGCLSTVALVIAALMALGYGWYDWTHGGN